MHLYQDEVTGSLYWLENGKLTYAPMLNAGGVIDTTTDGVQIDLADLDAGEVLSNGLTVPDHAKTIINSLTLAALPQGKE